MLRRRRSLREAAAGLAITVIGAVAVDLAVDSPVLRLAAVLLPLGVAAYAAFTWIGYTRSRAVYRALVHSRAPGSD